MISLSQKLPMDQERGHMGTAPPEQAWPLPGPGSDTGVQLRTPAPPTIRTPSGAT